MSMKSIESERTGTTDSRGAGRQLLARWVGPRWEYDHYSEDPALGRLEREAQTADWGSVARRQPNPALGMAAVGHASLRGGSVSPARKPLCRSVYRSNRILITVTHRKRAADSPFPYTRRREQP